MTRAALDALRLPLAVCMNLGDEKARGKLTSRGNCGYIGL